MKWNKICGINEIPKRGSRTVQAGKEEIALFHLTDGRFLAVENKCPHKDGPLAEGIVSDNTILCPLHNWQINLENGQVMPPDTGSVKTYPIKLEGNLVWIQC